jgi:small subunit ribosomal protein S20
MPTHKAAEKHLRTSKKRRMRNMAQKSMTKTAVKKVLRAENVESGQEALKSATSALDKLARKRIVPKKTVARYKSKLTKRVNTLGV